ncbi:MAG: hypothetical protein HRU18_12090 [Pseudoalteromonas sp.]|uniref:hypothetical protein n=1 Tax=Pseudoalteromonas sp. TaxID=53249 RepID=UPI001DD4EEC0|nr:hypothetical protein [Pseudoalteromonas sp.]NRA78942.1 hypothetical protein [Pseudoalteromonas sp.]
MAKQDFIVHIDGNQNELQNWSLEKLATDPATLYDGRIWQNTTEDRVKYYDGTDVRVVATLSDVEGLLNFKGGYNATTNVPNLETPAAGAITTGDAYIVTVGGDFFTEAVEPGDLLISQVDDPAALSDWVRVQANIPSGVAVKFAVDLSSVDPNVTRTFSGGQTTFEVTHSLNTLDTIVQIKRISDNKQFQAEIINNTVNTVQAIGNGNITNGIYRITVIG